MTVIINPIKAMLPEIVQPSAERPRDEAQSRTWESLGSQVTAFIALLELGEWHREIVDTTARKYAHNLRRRPEILIQTIPPNQPGFIYAPGGKEAWDKDTITLQSTDKILTVEFWLA